MKKFYQSILVLVSLCVSMLANANLVSAQSADLTLGNTTFSPQQVAINDLLTINAVIRNIGNRSSETTDVSFYLSSNPNSSTSARLLGRVSLESINANAQTSVKLVTPTPNVLSLLGDVSIIVRINESRKANESAINNNNYILNNTISIDRSLIQLRRNLPYPIIFVHGLNSDDKTWAEFKYFLAGRGFLDETGVSNPRNTLHFCLNQDRNNATARLANDYRDYTDSTSLRPNDVYFVNFNVTARGGLYPDEGKGDESDQAAIVKQGYAIKNAIRHVLRVTGAEKVILFGHSMGGLASREYLQNPKIWQEDGKHHVAKLVTTGTPHGGSNSTSFGVLILGGLNEGSEAVRDLRYQYAGGIGSKGVYLFGGRESTQVINRIGVIQYGNVDVNCNGVLNENIIGLNQKDIFNDLAYTCIIGTGDKLGNDDGVVDADRQNLNNYYEKIADTITVRQPLIPTSTTWHTELPKQSFANMRGLDEPATNELAYQIDFDKTYLGFFSQQSNNRNAKDVDRYTFTTDDRGLLAINIYNLPMADVTIELKDANGNRVFSQLSNGRSFIETTTRINAGKYFIDFAGVPDVSSWQSAYSYNLSLTPILDKPIIAFIGNTTFCQGDSLIITAPAGFDAYRYYVGRDSITSASRSGVIKNSGTFRVAVIRGNTLSPPSDPINVVVNPIPTKPVITSENGIVDILLRSNATAGNQWLLNGNPINGATSQTLRIALSGSYSVRVTVNNCSNTSSPINVTSVEDELESYAFKVYPNPSKDRFTIEGNFKENLPLKITIFDMVGRKVFDEQMNNISQLKTEIDLANFSNGLYLLLLDNGKQRISKRLIKEN